jgi:hypothetical protein
VAEPLTGQVIEAELDNELGSENHPISVRIATHHLLEGSLRTVLPWAGTVDGFVVAPGML